VVGAHLLQLASRLVELGSAFISNGATSLLVLLEATQQIVTLCNLGLGLAESALRELELALEFFSALLAFSLFGLQLLELEACVLELLLELRLALLPFGFVGLQPLQLVSRKLELTCLLFRLGPTRPLVFLQRTKAIVTRRKLCFGSAKSDFHFVSAALCSLEFLLELAQP
jgi:hypothetical protein